MIERFTRVAESVAEQDEGKVGIAHISQLFGCDPKTIQQGRSEIAWIAWSMGKTVVSEIIGSSAAIKTKGDG